ncbi:MAG TPA: hypothetical protein VLJ37_07055 [bacterium]|nr:hypothetical protein [bacterium]
MKPRARRSPSPARAEAKAWRKWNRQERTPDFTPEQILTWLDQTRKFMFEVWRRNPALRRRYDKLKAL